MFGHSKDTEILTELYRKSEELKFNLPVKNIKSTVAPKTKNRDIREMFGKSVQSQQDKNDFLTPPKTDPKAVQQTQETEKNPNSLAKNNAIYLSLLSEFTTNKTIELLLEKTCGICDELFDCKKLTEYLKLDDTQEIQSFTVPDESILDCPVTQAGENLSKIHENSFNTSNMCNISFKSDFDSFIQNSKTSAQNRSMVKEMDKSMHLTFEDDFQVSRLKMNKSMNHVSKTSVQNQSMGNGAEKSINSIFGDSFNVSELQKDKNMDNSSKFDQDFNVSELYYEKKDEKAIYELMEDSFQNSKSLIENKTFEEYSNTKSKISNVSVYQPDEISKQALKFFGLNSIENLFDDEVRLEQDLPPKFNIPKLPKQKIDNEMRLEQNLPATKQMNVKNKSMENDKKIEDYPVSPVLNSQKRFSSQTMTQSSSFFPKKTNFELWDESLFIDDSEIEDHSENQQLSPVLNTQPSFRGESQSFVQKSPILNSQSQTKIRSQKISPILSSQSQTKTRAQEISPILNSQRHRNSDSQIPVSKLSPILSSQRSKSINTPSISNINLDYLSDEDIFADEPIEDDLFFTAPSAIDDKLPTPKQMSPINSFCTASENKNSQISQKENTVKSMPPVVNKFNQFRKCIVNENENINSSSQKENVINNVPSVSNKLNQFRNNCATSESSNTNSSSQKENIVNNGSSFSDKLNHFRNNGTVSEKMNTNSSSQKENVMNNGSSVSNKLNQFRNNYAASENVNINSNSQKGNIVNNGSSFSNKLNQFRGNKLNMFQLKRNLNEVNSNIVNNSPNINFTSKASTSYKPESDSDDASLLDFVTRPSRKKLKLGLNKNNTSSNTITISDESIEDKSVDSSKSKLKESIVISDESIENLDEDHDKSIDLSVFSFVNRKKVLRQTNDDNKSLMGYEQHKNSGQQFRKTKKKKKRSEFIDYEAEVSDDEENSSDEDVDSDFESSFVVDNQTLTQTNVDMQALYLQSVKNNSQNGKFKIPNLPSVKMDEICSQADWNQAESNYVLDSFVVDNTIVMNEELSLLEIAEMELEKRKRRKRKNNSTTRKASRIRKLSDDSSDDEDLKRLRLECLNNQSVLR
ncbi:putative uncharacterized protein DDB_G0282133 [Chrysoperla carnea]|uniref:putative uncharacterized protein DDB_G0282133 n=1 Tax=Chrysoperla carnea TaxID=189513 RepID=UPI001D06066E|nr:putative uncharacterized protein DDB_G0282133 [Chrysoperla carnea]